MCLIESVHSMLGGYLCRDVFYLSHNVLCEVASLSYQKLQWMYCVIIQNWLNLTYSSAINCDLNIVHVYSGVYIYYILLCLLRCCAVLVIVCIYNIPIVMMSSPWSTTSLVRSAWISLKWPISLQHTHTQSGHNDQYITHVVTVLPVVTPLAC